MAARIGLRTEEEISKAVKAATLTLAHGELIVYPTDTIYGIGADPRNAAAVKKIHATKQRPADKPILLITHSVEAALPLIQAVSTQAQDLMEAFWPGPLTLVFKASKMVVPFLTSTEDTIALRIPDSPFCLRLLQNFDGPITSTSANVAGQTSPPTIDEIETMLGEAITLYVDGGKLTNPVPSTILDVSADSVRLVRAGAISPEKIRSVVSSLLVGS